jgi:neutral trehalase
LAWIDGAYIPDKGDSMALALALSQMKTQVYSPYGLIKQFWTTPDRWPHRRMWLWDSAFHAIGYRHLSLDLAKDSLDSVLDSQREDGFIPLCAPDYKNELTQPPVLALGYKLVNEMADDKSWIAKAYPKLKAYIEWDLNNRDSDGAGLVEWAIEGNVNCRSGESGMDNSPRFDSATQLDATDFNAMLALECEIMAEFAALLGNGEEDFWREKHSSLCALINERLWNESEGFYFDYDVDKNEISTVMASSGFLPLICGAASREQAQKLAGHLRDPETFGTPFPVASIAAKSMEFYQKDMWRGPVWININWLIAYGFRRYGMDDVAEYIISESMTELERACKKYGAFFEFFDDRKELDPPMLMRKGKNAPEVSPYHQAFFDFGWSATLYVDMAFN